MTCSSSPSVTRIGELQHQIALLANLGPVNGPVVSCYLDLRQERSGLKSYVRNELSRQLARVSPVQRDTYQACVAVIEAQLDSELPQRARGLAVFAAADGKAPLLSAMPFAVPFRSSFTVSASPDLLPLVQLKELYGRFMVVLADPAGLQLAEVNLGDVSIRAWASRSTHSVSRHAAEAGQIAQPGTAGLSSQVALIESRLCKGGGSCPVFLAGDVDVMQAVSELMGPTSVARLMGALPMPADASLNESAAECLRTLMDFEASQARTTAAQVLRGVRNQGHAVAGAAAVLDAMRSGVADRLVISSDYRPEPGRIRDFMLENRMPMTPVEPRRGGYSADRNSALEQRLELIRLAVQLRFPVEFADTEALHDLGGVGCLLRDPPQTLVQPVPGRYGSLDLVA